MTERKASEHSLSQNSHPSVVYVTSKERHSVLPTSKEYSNYGPSKLETSNFTTTSNFHHRLELFFS